MGEMGLGQMILIKLEGRKWEGLLKSGPRVRHVRVGGR